MSTENDWGSMTTSEDLVRQLLTSILGELAPGAGDFMTTLLLPQLRKLTGNDALWDMTLTTDMTSEGVFRHQQRRQLQQMEGLLAQDVQQKTTQNAIRNIEMTKMSYADWKLTNPEQSYEDYMAEIDKRTQSAMSNKFYTMGWGLVNGRFNLDGTAGVGQTVAQAASNLARYGFYRNDTNAMLAGRFMAENLFKEAATRTVEDENGRQVQIPLVDETTGRTRMVDRRFDKSEWGGMSQKAVAELAANITKDTDLLRGLDASNGQALSRASKEFTEMVHQYAEALAPLKDVFGNDTPRMLAALQRMTGQTMAQLGPARAAIASLQLSTRMNAGRYTSAYLGETTQAMGTLLEHATDLSSYHYLNAGGMGMRAADMARGGGFMPSYMTNEAWTRRAEKTAFTTSTSQATEMFALDYAIWAQRKLKSGASKATFEEFSNLVQAQVEQGVDARRAAGIVSGAMTYAEKTEGYGYAQFANAIQSGDAARMSSQGLLRQKRNAAQMAALQSTGIRNLVNRVYEGVENAPEYKDIVTTAMDVIQDMPEIQAQSADQLATFLQGKTIKGKTLDARQAEAVAGIINMAKARPEDTRLGQFIRQAGMVAGEQAMVQYGKNADARRELNKEAEKAMFSNEGIVIQLFENGFSIDRIRTAIKSNEAIRQSYDVEENAAILNAGMESARIRYKDDLQSGAAYVKRFHAYAISADGQSTEFKSQLEAYRKAEKAHDTAGMEAARKRMDAYLTFGIKATDRYITSTQYDEVGNKLSEAGSKDNLERLKGMSADELMMANARSQVFGLDDSQVHKAAKDMYRDFLLEAKKNGKTVDASSLARAWEERRSSLIEEDKKTRIEEKKSFDEYKRKHEDAVYTENTTRREAIDVIDRIMGSAAQGISPLGGSADRFELVTVLKQLTEALRRLSTDGHRVLGDGSPESK